ncbi:recombination-associated protein RdgC [Piscinibacter sp. XHJ-5]|uniref:recombination-associated protein RdgC n=1 Tax=Piscinibacter sp. XHJ-5 TaxID=3037797 RepID=UPI002452B893|nr:recombination-associated protein RdgC [Piscinibacter sp. XHJ-5]
MFKNALVYRIHSWDTPVFTELEERLATARFAACGATQMESAGWLQPRGDKHSPLIESVGGHWILLLGTETKAVPAAVVRSELEARLDQLEAETGRRPKGKRAKEIKEEIVHKLLPRAFPKRAQMPVWIDVRSRLVVIGAASARKADAIVTRLVELLGGGIVLRPLQTELSPSAAMSHWLTTQEAPPGFTIDRDCELKQPDSEKATVRYARHTLEIAEVAEHIVQGKLPTQLAMTWSGRVSFVLGETMALKKLKFLDVALEGAGSAAGTRDDGFDADVAIATGELAPMIAGLVDALGGELRETLAGPVAARPAANDEAIAA